MPSTSMIHLLLTVVCDTVCARPFDFHTLKSAWASIWNLKCNLLSAFTRYHAENRNLAHGGFKFGPLFMRLCYEMGLEDMAAATITDTVKKKMKKRHKSALWPLCWIDIWIINFLMSKQRMKGFFNEATSFNIAIDMLFTKGCYQGKWLI